MSEGQFKKGYQPQIQQQDAEPGQQTLLDPQPLNDILPHGPDGYEKYKAAGKLAGRKALITGGDSGIGRAIAVLFAMEGAESTINYLQEEEKDAQETKRLVEQAGGVLHLLPGNLRSAANCKALVEQAVKAMGGLTTLVNNAGTQQMVEKIADLPEEQWVRIFETNIHSIFYLSKYALPHMQRGDTVINCASVNPYIGRDDMLDYTSTKGAIVAFTRALSQQIVGDGIRVNAVCPGPIWTPLIPATMSKKAMESFNANPMGRSGQPSEIATCFVFLASNDSSFMSGQSLHPNGGMQVGS